MLRESKLACFIATAKPAEAKKFYESVLELPLVNDSPVAMVFDANGTTLRVQKVQDLSPGGYTALGWEVSNIRAVVEQLGKRGVQFEFYEGMSQDESGIWVAPNGSSVAWFKDPDGNMLSITQNTR